MDRVCDLGLPSELEQVLMRLARHADDDGQNCYPSVERLAESVGKKERAVQYALRSLEDRGLIQATSDRLGGRGRATGYTLSIPLKGASGCTLYKEERVHPTTPFEPETVQHLAPFSQERVQPSAERVQPDDVKGAPGCTPIGQEEVIEKVSTSTGGGKVQETISFQALSEGARVVVDDWRAKQGRKRPPTFNPIQAAKLEEAVTDLGVDRLRESNTWAAENAVPEFIKAVRAAYTKRKKDEEARSGSDRQAPSRNGSHASGGAADAPRVASPFAKYR